MKTKSRFSFCRAHSFAFLSLLMVLFPNTHQSPIAAFAQEALAHDAVKAAETSAIHQAARCGNLILLRSELQRGVSPNSADDQGRTPLTEAASAGQLEAVRLLLSAGANVNARTKAGRTALIEAAAQGRLAVARELVRAGAELNINQRGWGTALETAERAGHNQIAAMLRKVGAQSSGRSPGDKVCVRSWAGDGYCGTVEEVNKTQFRIRVTEIVGCEDGCPAKEECSAGRPVGGGGGIAVGDEVLTVSWCLTHTGVKP